MITGIGCYNCNKTITGEFYIAKIGENKYNLCDKCCKIKKLPLKSWMMIK